MILASLASQRNELSLWRFQEQTGWEEWFSRRVPPSPYIQLAVAGRQAEQSRLIINNELWGNPSGKWQKLAGFDETIRQMAFHPAHQPIYLLVGREVLTHAAGAGWVSVALCEEMHELIDIQMVETGELLGLDVMGVVWRLGD
jgi:hypothetical protein